jgi:Mor family transcriptional regulator
MSFPEDYPEQLEHIGQILGRELLALGLPLSVANAKAFQMAEAIRKELGGGAIYLPRGHGYELSLREQQIWGEFTGNNIPELATKYKLSQMQIRNILAKAKARDTMKRQPKLFG